VLELLPPLLELEDDEDGEGVRLLTLLEGDGVTTGCGLGALLTELALLESEGGCTVTAVLVIGATTLVATGALLTLLISVVCFLTFVVMAILP
jgi:hypothetical protein